MPPSSASATSTAVAGAAPIRPSNATAAVTGTTSATVIQSMPSMKLTRLTNHTPPTSRIANSSVRGSCGIMLKFDRQRRQHGADRQRLQHEPRRGAEPADVIDHPDQRKREGRERQRGQLRPGREARHRDPDPQARERRRHHGDAAALRGRLAVRGARVRTRQCVAHEQGPQHDDQPGARRDRRNQHQTEHRHRWPAVPHRTSNSHRPLFKLKRIPKETGCALEVLILAYILVGPAFARRSISRHDGTV